MGRKTIGFPASLWKCTSPRLRRSKSTEYAVARLPGEARVESRILLDLLSRLGASGTPAADASPAALFRAMAAELPGLEGLTLAKVGDLGVPLPGARSAREVEV